MRTQCGYACPWRSQRWSRRRWTTPVSRRATLVRSLTTALEMRTFPRENSNGTRSCRASFCQPSTGATWSHTCPEDTWPSGSAANTRWAWESFRRPFSRCLPPWLWRRAVPPGWSCCACCKAWAREPPSQPWVHYLRCGFRWTKGVNWDRWSLAVDRWDIRQGGDINKYLQWRGKVANNLPRLWVIRFCELRGFMCQVCGLWDQCNCLLITLRGTGQPPIVDR